MLLSKIKLRATWIKISGDISLVSGDTTSDEMTFGRLDRKPTVPSQKGGTTRRATLLAEPTFCFSCITVRQVL